MRRTVIVLSAAVALVLGTATSAWALLEVNGSQSCPGGITATAEYHYYGHEHDKGPGESAYIHRDRGASWGWASNGGPGGAWRGYIPAGEYGGLDNGTYSHCV